jgi:glycosyltransferase involved in cell wall biosynthesis
MKYSFVIPIYNDAYLVESFCENFEDVFHSYLNTKNIENDVELLFINDGSTNDSITTLKKISTEKKYVKVIDLSRNFGQHIALSCGYEHAKGEYVGMLNVDQQDPPSELPKLINFLKEYNYDIVFGTTDHRKTSLLNNLTSKLFAILLNKLTKSTIPLNVTTARVMNRKFVNAYNNLKEKSRYIPGLEVWLGFKHGYTPIIHKEREIGKSSYNFKKRLHLALDSVISFSDFPLKLIVTFGIFIALTGFLLILFLMISKIFTTDYKAGYTSTISIITFLGGVQIIVIGLASLYVGRILKEVQNRPLYIINNKYNFI